MQTRRQRTLANPNDGKDDEKENHMLPPRKRKSSIQPIMSSNSSSNNKKCKESKRDKSLVENSSESEKEMVKSMSPCHNANLASFSRSFNPSQIVGRKKERQIIKDFIEKQFLKETDETEYKSLYISGNPGTGKTALVSNLLREKMKLFLGRQKISVVFINCLGSLSEPGEIFQKLLLELQEDSPSSASLSSKKISKKESYEALANQVTTHKCLLVIDEIDALLTASGDLLYKLFELPFLKNSCCSVIGIANALDLTEYFLPLLIRRNYQPQTLHFAPYTAVEMSEILNDRISLLPQNVSIHPMALELCARKVAGMGDFRKALDIISQALELAKRDLIAEDEKVQVKIGHVIKVMDSQVQISVTKKLKQLNLHAKLALFAYYKFHVLPFIDKNDQKKSYREKIILNPIELSQFHLIYSKQIQAVKLSIAPITKSEFSDVCSTIENLGCISMELASSGSGRGKKSYSLSCEKKIKFNISVNELETFVETDPYLSAFI